VSIRRLFVLFSVILVVGVSATAGYLSWREASRAMEDELDQRLTWVLGAAAETGIQANIVGTFTPGAERSVESGGNAFWAPYQNRLARLRAYVSEAYIVGPGNVALVSSLPADSVPVGMVVHQLDAYAPEMDYARTWGSAATRAFVGSDGRWYKWGFVHLEQSPFLLAGLMRADYLAPLDRLRRHLVLGSALAAVLAAILAALLAARIVEPVERLSRVALRIQRGRMEEPVAVERGEELGRLARAMERMRKGILERDEQLRVMLAQVAHEIRNPLGGLELFASAAAETEDPAEQARLINRVRAEVAALNGIIDDFLTFARPLSPTREATDLRAPLRQAAELASAELQRRGGALDVTLPATPLLAKVGSGHAKRAALNLLRNAAQVAQNVRLAGWMENGEVVVSVSDDGPGVPADLRERIFDPFVTDKEQGAGLGLAIVRKVVEAHGGRVELTRTAETNGGRGSEFRLYFASLEDPPPPTSVV
jgi:two-component system OmpR family sensor kinase